MVNGRFVTFGKLWKKRKIKNLIK